MGSLNFCHFILCGIILGASVSQAMPLTETYRTKTLETLNVLEDMQLEKIACLDNFSSIGCLSPQHLKKVLAKVEFVELPQFEKPEMATRSSAFYTPHNNTIYLNAEAAHPPEIMGVIGLHELLGIANRHEREYAISMAVEKLTNRRLYNLSKSDIEFLINKVSDYVPTTEIPTSSIERDNRILMNGSGGAVVVGGGGDSDSLLARLQFNRYLSQSVAPKQTAPVIVHGQSVNIEVVDTQDEHITYHVQPKNITGWPQHIIVPKHLLQRPPQYDFSGAANWAFEDIAYYIASIYKGFFPQFDNLIELTNVHSRLSGKSFIYPVDKKVHPAAFKNRYQKQWKIHCTWDTYCNRRQSP